MLLETRLIPDPRKVRLRVYQTNSTHKSMSAIRQGSMLLVKDVDFHTVEAQFHEAVFTHASTSPNQQLIASLDVARRQMELEGYGLVMNAIEIALKIRQAVNKHPLISKYFRVLGADEMIPAEYRQSGFVDYLAPGANWGDGRSRRCGRTSSTSIPTRMTLVCGTAGFDGTQFKGLLANKYDIQLNKTSRNSRAAAVEHQQHPQRRRAPDPRAGRDLPRASRTGLREAARASATAFAARVKSLMTDVPDLPNFSHFHEVFRGDAGTDTPEGDMRTRLLRRLSTPESANTCRCSAPRCDERLREGPEHGLGQLRHPLSAGLPDHGARPGADAGDDRLHAQARCEGDPRLRGG